MVFTQFITIANINMTFADDHFSVRAFETQEEVLHLQLNFLFDAVALILFLFHMCVKVCVLCVNVFGINNNKTNSVITFPSSKERTRKLLAKLIVVVAEIALIKQTISNEFIH